MAATQSTSALSKWFPRRFPRWAKIAGVLLGLLLVVALVAPYFLDVDRYRPSIAAAIEIQTGRHVTLGKIRARFVPQVGFVVQDFHLGNPQGFPAGDLVTADEIRGNLAVLPLLHGTIHLNSLDVVGTKLTLASDERGQNNYTFSSSASGQTPSASISNVSAKENESSSTVTLNQIDSINLTGMEVLLGSIVRGAVIPTADAKNINVTLRNFVVNPVTVHAWQAESKLSGVTLALGGWSAPIEFHSGEVTLSDGKLDAQFVADLAKASDIKGTLSVPDVEKAQVNFEMSASKLDLDALVAAAGGAPGGSPAHADATAPTTETSEMVARGHINIEKITSKPYTVGPANGEIRVYTNRAELWPITIGMYGGTLQVSARVDRVTNPARFSANVQMRNLDVAKVLDVSPSARGKMGGTGELDLQLLGSMDDAWRKSISGTGKFTVRDGHLPGVNLGGLTQSLGKLAGVVGNTPFTILEGDLNIASQRVSSKQIHLDSPSGIVDLHGSVGLDGMLDYQGQASLSPAGILGGSSALGGIVGGLLGSRVGKITVPFSLGGTIANPKVRPGNGISISATPASASGAAPSSSQPATTQNSIGTLKDLFKKH